MPAYDIQRERFALIVPETGHPVTNWGLFVWISPGDPPKVRPDWEPVLARQKLLFVAAWNSGNEREVFARVRLAVDASFNMRQHFRIDPKRIYIAGFSGGGRVASMVALSYADIFTGAIPICGVNFYADLADADGTRFGRTFAPPEALIAMARKNSRIALITGERDINRTNTKAAYEDGYKKDGFAHLLYLEVPGMAHVPPSGNWLEKALEFLPNAP